MFIADYINTNHPRRAIISSPLVFVFVTIQKVIQVICIKPIVNSWGVVKIRYNCSWAYFSFQCNWDCSGDCFCSRLKYFQELCLFLRNNCNLSCSALALYICAMTTDVFQTRLSRRCICILVSSAGAEWCLAYAVSPPLSQSVWFKRHSSCVKGKKTKLLSAGCSGIHQKISATEM